jgi:glycosyltransferase involved in cell wall biosynthesis
MKSQLSVIILTYNEEVHLDRCLRSVTQITDQIFIIDSFSNDSTLEICEKFKCKIYQHTFENHAKQFNWALENIPIKTDWVMRLDADEYLTKELQQEIKNRFNSLDNDITGVILKRRVYFMNRWIKRGGYYPIYLLRVWRSGSGKCEERWMDEHIKLSSGKTVIFDNDIVDENLNNLTWWIKKHNNYATREAIDMLNIKYSFFQKDWIDTNSKNSQAKMKRIVKENFYSKLSLFIRPFLYFLYRYILRLGFLDGREGLIFHVLQGFWYRFLVDAKIYQLELLSKKQNKPIQQIIKEHYGIEI